MSQLLAIRDVIHNFIHYNRKWTYPILRFLLYATFLQGYGIMFGFKGATHVSMEIILILLGLAAVLFPVVFLYFFVSFLTAFELYFITPELGIGFGLISTILYLLYFRYNQKLCLLVLAMPIAYVWNIPCLIPLLAGMLVGYTGVVPVIFGIGTYYFAQYMMDYKTVAASGTLGDLSNGMLYVLKHMNQDKSMWIAMATAAVVILIVNYIYHLNMDHAWTAAVLVGAVVNILLLLVGGFIFEKEGAIGTTVVQTLLSVVVAFLIQLYRNVVDFSRVEWVEFDDEEYYYYVKAVPKVKVGVRNVKTTKISGEDREEEV